MDPISMARAAEAVDGVAALDEATQLQLRHHPERALRWGDDRGFGLLLTTAGAEERPVHEFSLLVMPHERGRGLGRRLLMERDLPAGRVTAWSHGDHPAAAALATHAGFERVRELWVMRRSTTDLPALPSPPDDVEVRGFRYGDEDELLRVNAAAFADHPEQGAMDRGGLTERMAESWFDPAGLLEAWDRRSGRLLGFHWTKRHSEVEGEVYVVGVDPAAQGRGVGKLLTLAGLHHLAADDGDAPGVDAIHLYVEADNAPATALYGRLGFTREQADTHVQYARG